MTGAAAGAAGARFPIPLYVLNGSEFSLQADVSFPMSELLKNRRECDDLGCETDNRFRLDGVPVARMPALTVLGVEMYNGQTAQKDGLFDGSKDKDGNLIRANADRVMAKARQVWPGGESLLLRIARAPLRLLDADVPQRVARGARRMAVRFTVSAAATLRAGGRSYRLRAGANRVTLTLPRRPATGLVTLPLRIGTMSTEVTVYRDAAGTTRASWPGRG